MLVFRAVSRIVRTLAVTAATMGLAAMAVPGLAMAGDDEVVMTTAHPAALPTAAEQAKAQADAKAKAAAAPKPMTTQDQIVAWLADAPPVTRNGRNVADETSNTDDSKTGPRQIHGEASVSIGTGGYRSAYVSSYIPVGDTGILGIAVSQTDYGKTGGYGYDNYGYDGYGYGRGYGRGYGHRGGTSQSVALSLDMSGDSRTSAATPEGCAPGFRDGGRYLEPLWVTRLNGNRACDSAFPADDK